MQEIDADKRIQILRGTYDESRNALQRTEDEAQRGFEVRSRGERKRRRIAGEDDTDREIRYAREDKSVLPARAEMQMISKKTSDAPLTDNQGHINLFPREDQSIKRTKNAEAEREKAQKKKEHEDQYIMRFSNAAGFKQAVEQRPWYENSGNSEAPMEAVHTPSKDVWGNEDPRRKEREKIRMAADDPLISMRNGAAGVRHAEKERLRWTEEKRREIKELDKDERRRERRRRRHQEDIMRRSSPGCLHKTQSSQHHRDMDADLHHAHRHRRRRPESGRYGSRRHDHRSHDQAFGVPAE